MTKKLKPCPFCSGEAEIITNEDNEFFVSCTKCLAVVGYYTNNLAEYKTEEEAIVAWNRRVLK